MNSCVLMAKIVRSPELRYTQDNQTPVTHMLVEFQGTREENAPATLRVVGWGNFATEIKEKYTEGDSIIIEGRLSINMVERQEGFKEKRAELVASRIYPLTTLSTSPAASRPLQPLPEESEIETETTSEFSPPISAPVQPEERNLDDIPF